MKPSYSLSRLFVIVVMLFMGCTGSQTGQETIADTITPPDFKILKTAQEETTLSPKTEKFTWQFGMCEYTATYDANKFTKDELDNTLKYLIYGEGASKPTMFFNIGDVEKINRAEIDSEFEKNLKMINSLNFIKTEPFSRFRQKRIVEIKRMHLVSLMEIDAYKNPSVLKDDEYSKNKCSKYTNALIEGGDALLQAWKELAKKWRDEGNSTAWDRYENERSSPQKMEYARIQVTTFGWWNEMNNSIERVDSEQVNEAFKKLFTEVKIECEEP